jgi:hypothetical protein
MLTVIISIALTLFLLPALVIYSLTTLALNSRIPYECIDESTLSDAEKEQAKACFDEAKKKCRKVTFYDVTAPYVMLVVLPFVKWEAEKLPKLFHKWDNEVSLNGDRALEWNPDGSRKPVPLEDTPEVRALAYYAEGSHPRSFWARYKWLGYRNRASNASYLEGFEMTPELRASHRMIGDMHVGEMKDGQQVMGTLIRNCGPYYEVFRMKDLGNKVQRTRFGYKIGNAMGNDPELTRAMVVGIGFSYKRKKK